MNDETNNFGEDECMNIPRVSKGEFWAFNPRPPGKNTQI